MLKQMMLAGAVAGAALAAPLALAQSHSVTNMANPPQGASDSKPATEATPSHTATAEKRDVNQPATNKPNGKWHPPVTTATDDKGKVRNDIGAAQAGNEVKETMQVDPSESQVSPAERRALDVSAAKK